jgi:hypothetical protein
VHMPYAIAKPQPGHAETLCWDRCYPQRLKGSEKCCSPAYPQGGLSETTTRLRKAPGLQEMYQAKGQSPYIRTPADELCIVLCAEYPSGWAQRISTIVLCS